MKIVFRTYTQRDGSPENGYYDFPAGKPTSLDVG